MLLQGENHHNQYCTNEQKVTGVIGSLIVFSIFTYHSRNNFTRPHGERYVFIVRWGRRDHPWEGQSEYVMSGNKPAFANFIRSPGTKSNRELFHLPPAHWPPLLHSAYASSFGGPISGLGYQWRIPSGHR